MKKDWTYKKLGEVLLVERGGSPRPIQEYITTADDGLNWIKIGDAVEGSKYITSTKEKIKPVGIDKPYDFIINGKRLPKTEELTDSHNQRSHQRIWLQAWLNQGPR